MPNLVGTKLQLVVTFDGHKCTLSARAAEAAIPNRDAFGTEPLPKRADNALVLLPITTTTWLREPENQPASGFYETRLTRTAGRPRSMLMPF